LEWCISDCILSPSLSNSCGLSVFLLLLSCPSTSQRHRRRTNHLRNTVATSFPPSRYLSLSPTLVASLYPRSFSLLLQHLSATAAALITSGTLSQRCFLHLGISLSLSLSLSHSNSRGLCLLAPSLSSFNILAPPPQKMCLLHQFCTPA